MLKSDISFLRETKANNFWLISISSASFINGKAFDNFQNSFQKQSLDPHYIGVHDQSRRNNGRVNTLLEILSWQMVIATKQLRAPIMS